MAWKLSSGWHVIHGGMVQAAHDRYGLLLWNASPQERLGMGVMGEVHKDAGSGNRQGGCWYLVLQPRVSYITGASEWTSIILTRSWQPLLDRSLSRGH